jgi:hypothetical protein
MLRRNQHTQTQSCSENTDESCTENNTDAITQLRRNCFSILGFQFQRVFLIENEKKNYKQITREIEKHKDREEAENLGVAVERGEKQVAVRNRDSWAIE